MILGAAGPRLVYDSGARVARRHRVGWAATGRGRRRAPLLSVGFRGAAAAALACAFATCRDSGVCAPRPGGRCNLRAGIRVGLPPPLSRSPRRPLPLDGSFLSSATTLRRDARYDVTPTVGRRPLQHAAVAAYVAPSPAGSCGGGVTAARARRRG